MDIKLLEQKYQFQYEPFFKKLWKNGMIDWYKGWDKPWTPERNWYTEVYPTIKDNPPVLLHTGVDYEMLSPKEMLNYEFIDYWDVDKHKFIPFGQSGAGDLYAFYKNKTKGNQTPVVMVWHDDNRTEILSKNFEDFIFRQFLEKISYLDDDDISLIKNDFKTMKPFFNKDYIALLEHIFKQKKPSQYLSKEKLQELLKETIGAEYIDNFFEHEILE